MRKGQKENWVRLMEDKIIPFQIAQGMVVIGSFCGEQEKDLYVWIRRFESEEQREELYEKVYQSDYWKNEISTLVEGMLDRSQIKVTRLKATPKSVIQ